LRAGGFSCTPVAWTTTNVLHRGLGVNKIADKNPGAVSNDLKSWIRIRMGNQYGPTTLLRTSKKNTGISEGSWNKTDPPTLFCKMHANALLAVTGTSPYSGKHYFLPRQRGDGRLE
jgi:hypothetical protein